MKTRNNEFANFAFDVWVNDEVDFLSNIADHDDIGFGSFDDNWLVSAGDLFGRMELPVNEPVSYYDNYDEAA